jgi:hypothetical protein
MSLQGFIRKLQNSCTRIYLDLAQSFMENSLIRETWVSMAEDKEEQARCLNALPSRFWSRHNKEEALFEAVQACLKPFQHPEHESDRSLQSTFARVFDLEEPIILKVYAPLIRHLRTGWTDNALDFYIMIKAHVARLARITQSFSGDPALIQRFMTLLVNFEKAVQAPDLQLLPEKTSASPRRSAQRVSAAKLTRVNGKQKLRLKGRKVKSAMRTHPLGNRAKAIPKRSKPPLKKFSLTRRRARS